MGFSIISYYKKIKKEYKMAFLFSFVIGLLVHFYKFANYLPNHDSMYNFYNDQNALGSGRWFLSIACGFSSYFDLPWVTGILSLLFISLTSVVIVSVFEIKNPVVIFLASGILVTFPSTTEILCFGFTSDGFFLSMLLATLAVYAIKINKTKIFNIFLSAVLVCLSCGIYQAYVSFTLVLFICYLLKNLIYDNYSVKQYIRYILSQAIAIVVGLASYFVIWKICMLVQGISANDYQGISEVGAISINTIVGAM
ncbi:MAG: glucosyltransferase domain-containing protein, partial [Ruminococcus sp.]